jgi:hypothetical protein
MRITHVYIFRNWMRMTTLIAPSRISGEPRGLEACR